MKQKFLRSKGIPILMIVALTSPVVGSITTFADVKTSVTYDNDVMEESIVEETTATVDDEYHVDKGDADAAYERAEQKAIDIYDGVQAQIEKSQREGVSVMEMTESFFKGVYDFYRLIKQNVWVLLTVIWLFSVIGFMMFKKNKGARKRIIKGAVILTFVLLCFTFGGGMFFG